MKEQKWKTRSAGETIRLAKALARALKPGTVVALVGALGSGKTTFVKGLASGLGVVNKRSVRSPTFVIFHIYKGRIPVYHFDLYRFEPTSGWDELGLDEYLNGADVVSVVEWADRIPSVLERADVVVRFFASGEHKRFIKVQSRERTRKHSCR